MVAETTTESLAQFVAPYAKGEPVQFACFLGKTPVFARDSGEVVLGAPEQARSAAAHADGTVLVAASTGALLLTGGDDGLVVATAPDGTMTTLHDAGGKWIDGVTGRADNAIAWSVGKRVFARDPKGAVRETSAATTVRGLAFAPKGYRLAVAHYNGASLWFPNTDSPLDTFEWKGSHLAVTFSPDARFLVTSMQENALHGWRIADRANMRMSGYPAKVRSLAWSSDGAWLATSGADSCVCWPFQDRSGPMNRAPREVAVRKAKVSKVAFHPKAELLAIGYEDGWVLLCRVADNTEILARRPDADRDAITALAWSADGNRLLYGTAGGEAGLLSLP